MRWAVCLMVALGCALAGLSPAEAQVGKRVALVIGNADYRIGRLANPVNDAEAVADVLEKQLKLHKVILKRNLNLDGLRAALREMARESAGAELGLIYFAGHGIEVAGRNFLIPTDAALETARDVKLEAIELDTVLEHLDGVAKLRLVILDACRNNPFPAAKRGGSRGLGRIEPAGGTLVAYAAKEGTTAHDGQGDRHSPFTSALLKHIVMPGVDVRRVFGYVSEDVLAATARAQEPYLYGRLGGDEVHLLPKTGSDPAGLTPGHPVLLPAPPSAAALEWARVDKASVAELETFERRHPTSVEAEYARARLKELRKVAVVAPPAPPTVLAPPPPPEVAALNLDKRAAAPLTAAEERALKPKETFKECAECPEMVVVPAGSFMMGSPPWEEGRDSSSASFSTLSWRKEMHSHEGPQSRVTIARSFAVGKFEVTFTEWDSCQAERWCLSRPDDVGWGRGKRPIMNVSWNDVTQQYLPWLSHKTGKGYRLLTEAEWEYAARAGTTTPYWWGSSISASQANYSGADPGEYPDKTIPVYSFGPNPWGLYNVHGNVSEWVQDCWNGTYGGAPTDGSAWGAGDCGSRVIRGGSWTSKPRFLRAASRDRAPTVSRFYNTGFRVARTF